jgi:hypothetical protein
MYSLILHIQAELFHVVRTAALHSYLQEDAPLTLLRITVLPLDVISQPLQSLSDSITHHQTDGILF